MKTWRYFAPHQETMPPEFTIDDYIFVGKISNTAWNEVPKLINQGPELKWTWKQYLLFYMRASKDRVKDWP